VVAGERPPENARSDQGLVREMEAASLRNNPDKREYFAGSCTKLGLDPEQTSTFAWLENHDRASFNVAAA